MKNLTNKQIRGTGICAVLIIGLMLVFAASSGGDSMSDIYRAQAKAIEFEKKASDIACGKIDRLLTEEGMVTTWEDYAELAGYKWSCENMREILTYDQVEVVAFWADDRPRDQVEKDLELLLAHQFDE